jgi:DNA-binding helix-hairpin-helix protein with protein kinase domain
MTDELDRSSVGQLGPQLGSGGQAVVYLAPDLRLPDVSGALVFKQYKGNQVSPNGLRAIVGVRSKLDPAARRRLDAMAAWPVRAVRDAGRICGVVLPLIPDTFFQERVLPTGRHARGPREVQNLFVDPALAARLGMPGLTLGQRFGVCRDLAAALALLHENGVVFGDINAKNELYREARSRWSCSSTAMRCGSEAAPRWSSSSAHRTGTRPRERCSHRRQTCTSSGCSSCGY